VYGPAAGSPKLWGVRELGGLCLRGGGGEGGVREEFIAD